MVVQEIRITTLGQEIDSAQIQLGPQPVCKEKKRGADMAIWVMDRKPRAFEPKPNLGPTIP